jgi:hypothetical protein
MLLHSLKAATSSSLGLIKSSLKIDAVFFSDGEGRDPFRATEATLWRHVQDAFQTAVESLALSWDSILSNQNQLFDAHTLVDQDVIETSSEEFFLLMDDVMGASFRAFLYQIFLPLKFVLVVADNTAYDPSKTKAHRDAMLRSWHDFKPQLPAASYASMVAPLSKTHPGETPKSREIIVFLIKRNYFEENSFMDIVKKGGSTRWEWQRDVLPSNDLLSFLFGPTEGPKPGIAEPGQLNLQIDAFFSGLGVAKNLQQVPARFVSGQSSSPRQTKLSITWQED